MAEVKIDLVQYRKNLETIQERIHKESQLIAIVKSDAYGLGMARIAQAAYEAGVRWFGIANVQEAKELRTLLDGKEASLLLVSPFLPAQAKDIIKTKVIPIISSVEEIEALSAASLENGCVTDIHIGADTGMGRMGFSRGDLENLLRSLNSWKGVRVTGVFSHFSSSDEEDEVFSKLQIKEFHDICENVREKTQQDIFRHIANSAAVFHYPDSFFDGVRCGLAAYGAKPSSCIDIQDIKPVLSIEAKVVLVKELKKGSTVSYGRTFRTSSDTRIALVDVGYGEGYSRKFSSSGFMLVRGKRVPVLGRVTMDLTILDVSGIEDVRSGDIAVVLGRQGEEEIRVEDYSRSLDTIPYEVFCVMGKILPRVYKS